MSLSSFFLPSSRKGFTCALFHHRAFAYLPPAWNTFVLLFPWLSSSPLYATCMEQWGPPWPSSLSSFLLLLPFTISHSLQSTYHDLCRAGQRRGVTPCCRACGVLVPRPGVKSMSLHWECIVLITAWPRKSTYDDFYCIWLFCLTCILYDSGSSVRTGTMSFLVTTVCNGALWGALLSFCRQEYWSG